MMTLTPVELESHRFSRAMRGYDVVEVDGFFQRVLRDYEELYRESLDHNDRLNQLTEELAKYKDLERVLNETMVLAQQTSEETKSNARKEAELILKDAEVEGQRRLRDVVQKVAEQEARLKDLIKEQRLFAAQWRASLMAQLELIDIYVENAAFSDKSAPEEPEEETQMQEEFTEEANVEMGEAKEEAAAEIEETNEDDFF